MKNRTVYLLVNGINTHPGRSKNWNGRAVTWVHINTPHKAEKIEYFCGPIGRAFGQKNRVKKLYRTLSYYAGWNIVLVGHSNGCAVILEMLKKYCDFPYIKQIHLVAGACNADFNKNGLNKLLIDKRIGKVNVYVAGKDDMLKLARTWIGKLLGYGDLGYHGPWNLDEQVENKVDVFWKNPWINYDHSTCWENKNFDKTMNYFIKGD